MQNADDSSLLLLRLLALSPVGIRILDMFAFYPFIIVWWNIQEGNRSAKGLQKVRVAGNGDVSSDT